MNIDVPGIVHAHIDDIARGGQVQCRFQRVGRLGQVRAQFRFQGKRLFILRPLQIGIRIFLTAGLFRELIDELRQDRGRLVDIHAGNAQHRFVEDTTLGFRVVGGDSGGAKGLLRDAFKTIQGGFQ